MQEAFEFFGLDVVGQDFHRYNVTDTGRRDEYALSDGRFASVYFHKNLKTFVASVADYPFDRSRPGPQCYRGATAREAMLSALAHEGRAKLLLDGWGIIIE